MGDTGCEIEFFQYLRCLLAEPGFIPELKDMAEVFGTGERGEKDTELLQSLLLKFESRRKLPKHCSQFLFQW